MQNHPTYASAHIFFTSKVAPQHLAALKGCPGLLSRLRALAEVPHGSHSQDNSRLAGCSRQADYY